MWTAIKTVAGSAFKWVKGNARLVIEYVLIALIVTIAGFTATIWIDKLKTEVKLAETAGVLQTVKNTVTILEDVADSQGNEITTLKNLRQIDSDALTALVDNMKKLAQKDSQVRARLQHLEDTNEVVRAYMDTPIPPDVACMHDDACEEGGGNGEGNKNGIHRGPETVPYRMFTSNREPSAQSYQRPE